MTEVGLIALPMTFIIITGGIDLSVGSIMGLCAIMLGYSWKNWGLPLELAIVVALVVGRWRGFVNGWFITRVRRAAADHDAGRRWRSIAASPRASARRARCAAIPTGSSCSARARCWACRRSSGSCSPPSSSSASCWRAPPSAARSTRSATTRRRRASPASRSTAYKLVDLHALRASWPGSPAAIFVSRVSTTRSDMGTGLELDVIAAVVLGGTCIFGGIGTIVGTVLGLVLIQLLKNGLALTGRQGRRHHRRDRHRADPLDPDHQLRAAPPAAASADARPVAERNRRVVASNRREELT